jgi:hypothetical protein
MASYNDNTRNDNTRNDNTSNDAGSQNDQSSAITFEQAFQLETLKRQIAHLSAEDARDYLLELLRQVMVKDNLVKDMFRDCYL